MIWNRNKKLGMLLLGIWLVLTGASAFVHVTFANMGLVLALLAIAAGILILLNRRDRASVRSSPGFLVTRFISFFAPL